jgi:hypothetical protein
MEGFKKLPKMQHFKVGGSVAPKFKSVVEKTTAVKPTGNKKANAKSAAVMPTEKEAPVQLTGLKKGGRAKKAVGTLKKFEKKAAAPSKAATKPNFKGSDVSKQKSKPSGEKDKIKKVKPTGDKKADAPSKGKVKGKEIKKFADGGLTGQQGLTPAYSDGPGIDQPYYPPEFDPQRPQQPIGYNPGFGGNTFNNSNNMNANVSGGGGGGYGLGGYPYPQQPYAQPQQPGSNVFNNTNTMNANVGGGGYGLGDTGIGGPVQKPMDTSPFQDQNPFAPQANPQSTATSPSSVNLLPGLFGGK